MILSTHACHRCNRKHIHGTHTKDKASCKIKERYAQKRISILAHYQRSTEVLYHKSLTSKAQGSPCITSLDSTRACSPALMSLVTCAAQAKDTSTPH